jgi:DNA uptake protein ComE-like DNA-binding protein
LASLMRLPGVGPQRAQAIVDYRTKIEGERGSPAFRDLKDLDSVPGLGPVTVQVLAPYLRFSD